MVEAKITLTLKTVENKIQLVKSGTKKRERSKRSKSRKGGKLSIEAERGRERDCERERM